jgi:sterol desaturase/sphingolipid hydroxylase (fatty acid hydroxylase superfamily)
MPHSFDPGLILLGLAPVFIGCIVWEALYLKRSGHSNYSWPDTLSNAALALMHQGADLAANLLFIKTAYAWVYQRGLHALPDSSWAWLAAFVLQDFIYYFWHRASHRVRWMWASHVTHHSSERLNLSTAFRQSLTYHLSGMWLAWLPLAWLGLAPNAVLLVVGLNLAFQFFVHTETVGKLGWLEQVFNTPSHHRVHHARNPGYIDRNFGGVLIIWDRCFGTFVEEVEAPVYGIVRQVGGHNPIKLTFHEWADMWRDCLRRGDLRHLYKPPEWTGSPKAATHLAAK